MIKRFPLIVIAFCLFASIRSFGQNDVNYQQILKDSGYFQIKLLPFTEVKNQGATGTCWNFSTLSFIESELAKKGKSNMDLSEMYLVHEIYLDKAKNYILRQGNARFSEGGLGHDVIRGIEKYGLLPEEQFSGYISANRRYSHVGLEEQAKKMLDDIIASKDLQDWELLYSNLLHRFIPRPPKEFKIEDKLYSPQSYAKEKLNLNMSDYIGFTSFTHHPFYRSFIVEVPDNYSNGAYYNLPIDTLFITTKEALNKGYTVLWDADVSNAGFRQNIGLAMNIDRTDVPFNALIDEKVADQQIRQRLFENLTTQDDHLMHIIGSCTNKNGECFFIVKNSWGSNAGPLGGLIVVSEAYFKLNTITTIINKSAVHQEILKKLKGPGILD